MRTLKQPGFVEASRHRRCVAGILAAAAMGITVAASGQGVPEFPIPTAGSQPLSIVAGPDGNLWFTESNFLADKIGRITTAGVITEFVIPTAFAEPSMIAAGPDGNLWFAERAQIGRITPAGVITEFPLPITTGFTRLSGIAAGPDGNLWFTENGDASGDKIGKITTAGVVTGFPLPSPFSALGGIAAGPDGNLWFIEGVQIGRITTAGVVTEFPVHSFVNFFSGTSGIVAGPDGALWFTEAFGDKIGRITTAGVVTEFPIPSYVNSPSRAICGIVGSGIAAGPDGALWFTEFLSEFGGGKIGRITTAGVITEFVIPTFNSQPFGIANGPDGNLWFTEYLGNKIGRLTPSAACPASATNLCLNNARFKVEATWTASDGRSGPGQAVATSPDGGSFWFFSPVNVELMVKALNGCSFNNHYWVFGAGLTNVNVVLKVTDTHTGQVNTYTNPQGAAFQPIQDLTAFACPERSLLGREITH